MQNINTREYRTYSKEFGVTIRPDYRLIRKHYMAISNKVFLDNLTGELITELDQYGENLFHILAIENDYLKIRQLLQSPLLDLESINLYNNDGKTPFYLAAERGYIEVMQEFLNSRKVKSVIIESKTSCTYTQTTPGILIKRFFNYFTPITWDYEIYHENALFLAIRHGHIDAAALLIQSGKFRKSAISTRNSVNQSIFHIFHFLSTPKLLKLQEIFLQLDKTKHLAGSVLSLMREKICAALTMPVSSYSDVKIYPSITLYDKEPINCSVMGFREVPKAELFSPLDF